MYELTKEQRLCKNHEYQLVYRRGKSYVNRRVVLYVLPRSPKQPTRIGFVTGKKIGCAVERNRCRRLMKSIACTSLNCAMVSTWSSSAAAV